MDDEDVFELALWISHDTSYQPTAAEMDAMKRRYAELNPCNPESPNEPQALATALLKVLAED